MKTKPDRSQPAFTLIELMVVVTIIAVLAALIVPALQKAQSKAMAAKCQAAARGIATSVRTYSNNWGGWTNSDRDSFVKEFGYKLTSEAGYFPDDDAGAWYDPAATTPSQSQLRHAAVRDFFCPVDESPRMTDHGIPSSYLVMVAGANLMSMTGDASRILMVGEVNELHPSGSDGTRKNNAVFADLSAKTGVEVKLRGAKWGGYNWGVEQNVPVFTAIWTSGVSVPAYGIANKIPTTAQSGLDWETPYTNIRNFYMRMLGYLDIPEAGDWLFRTTSDDGSTAYIDIDDDGSWDSQIDRNTTRTVTFPEPGKYRFGYNWHEGGGNDYFTFYWQAPSDAALSTVPESALWYSLTQKVVGE